jgi:hypothetical protein
MDIKAGWTTINSASPLGLILKVFVKMKLWWSREQAAQLIKDSVAQEFEECKG